MKVCFVSLPAYGHLFPMMPLAEAMQRCGAEASVAVGAPQFGTLPVRTIPGGRTDTNQMRLAAQQAMRTWPQARDDMRSRWVPTYFGYANVVQQLPQLRQSLVAERPDLVVWEVLAPAGALVADELQVPSVCFGLGMVWHWTRAMLPMARRAAQGAFDDPTAATPPWEVPADPEPLRYIDPMPTTLQANPTDGLLRVPIRPDGWSNPASRVETPSFDADHRRPRVYMTLGTVFGRENSVIHQAVDAVGQLDVETVVALGAEGDPAALGTLPQGVSAHRFVAQADLLREVDLVVHHGGAGTTLSSAAAGIPQLVLPQGADQFFNAAAIAQAGCGRRLSGENQSADRIRDDVAALLQDGPERGAAQRLAAEIAAMPSPDEVARQLLDV